MGTQDGRRAFGIGRLWTAVILVLVALNLFLLGRMLRTKDRAEVVRGDLAEGARELPAAPVSALPDAPRGPEASAGRQEPAAGRSPAEDRGRTYAGTGYDLRGDDSPRSSPGQADPRSPGARRAPGDGEGGSPSIPSSPAAPSRRPPESLPAAPAGSRPAGAVAPVYEPPARPAEMSREDSRTDPAPPAVEADPESDRTPPLLEILAFDPPEVEDGSTSTLVIQASDDLSGVKLVWGVIRSPSGVANLQFGPQDQGDNTRTAFKIPIPNDAETGLWYVATLSLTDRAGNSVVRTFTPATALPGGTLRVVSAGSDSTAPEVLQIWVDKPAVEGGEVNSIRVEARDDRSGVASVTGYFLSPSKAAQLWFNCVSKPDSPDWGGDVRVPANADCGEWRLQHLKVVDKAGNVAYLQSQSPVLAAVAFQVSGGSGCDSSPPTLDAFALSPAVVSNETVTEILVTATVSDVGSGAISMTGWFEGPVSTSGQAPRNYFSCSPDRRDPEAPWTGKITVPQFAAKGVWKVGVISLQDKARNFRQYTSADPVVAGVVFEVR